MNDAAAPKLYPAWRQVEADLLATGITYGSLITDEWLDEAFGIKPPKTIAEYKRAELIRLSQIESLKESLLENHRMLLARVKSVGYTVLPPEQQTRHVMDNRMREVRAAFGKLNRELTFVDVAALNDAQRKENSDALAKLGMLRSFVRKRIKDQR